MEVWIIDDDLVSRFATQYSVQQSRVTCTVKNFESALEALSLIQQSSFYAEHLPDIILLDLVMPEMDGWGFLKELKKIEKIKSDMQIYILSAFTNYKDRNLAKEHPLIHGYFDKPLSKVNIEQIFSSVLK